MLALLLEDDQHSNQVLVKMLAQLGYSQSITATSADEASFYFNEKNSQIDLILSSELPNEGPDIPLSRLILQKRNLDLAPFILMTEHWRPRNLSLFENRMSRVDAIISRPFGLHKLRTAIAASHQRRSALRSSLILIGNQHLHSLSEMVYSSREDNHWKKIVSVTNLSELEVAVAQSQFYLGTILVEPAAVTDEICEYLVRFKKAHSGSLTPLLVLSREAESIGKLRLIGDSFWEEPLFREMLSSASHRLRHQWEVRELLRLIRFALKSNNLKQADRYLAQSLNLDFNRWEFQQLAGTIALEKGDKEASILHFEKSISSQPCSPYSYLQALPALSSEERKIWLMNAKRFCPSHPEIQALTENGEVS